jgi:hypothetical protein
MMGMICGLALNLYLWLFTSVAFTWYVVLGSVVTFAVGYAASLALGQKGIENASA